MIDFLHRHRRVIIFLTSLFVVSLVISSWAFRPHRQGNPSGGNGHADGQDQAVNQQDEEVEPRITSETQIMMRTVYLDCEDGQIETVSPGEEDVGLDVKGVQKKYSDWEIIDFSSERILLSKEVAGLCPNHRKGRYLGIKDGYVTIFAGSPDLSKKIVLETTGIPASYLDTKIKNILEKGTEFAYYIGIAEGFITVYLGNAGYKNMIVYERTGYSTEFLPPQELADLREYIRVEDKKELMTILESYAELTGNFQ